jgi:hypothetical protein
MIFGLRLSLKCITNQISRNIIVSKWEKKSKEVKDHQYYDPRLSCRMKLTVYQSLNSILLKDLWNVLIKINKIA